MSKTKMSNRKAYNERTGEYSSKSAKTAEQAVSVVKTESGAEKVCGIYKKCSGCQLMNLTYPEQLSLKQSMIVKLYGSYCHVDEIIGMENPYHYRNKASEAFKLTYPNKRIISGVYQSKTGAVIPCDGCLLENKKSHEIIKSFKKLMPKYKLLPYDEYSHKGLIRHVMVRRADVTGEYMVVIVTSSPIFPKGKELAAELVLMYPEIKTVVQNISTVQDKMMLGEQEKVLFGEGTIKDKLLGAEFIISPRSFYQINHIQTEKLYSKAIEFADISKDDTVLDCYCGIGTIGIIASRYAGEVMGVESNPAAVRDAVKNARLNNVKNARFIAMDAGKMLSELAMNKVKADIAILDPARAGCDKAALEALIKIGPKRIVYVSCNPETQIRDVKTLISAGYKVKKVQGVDMFPFTKHVECVVELTVK